MLIWAFVYSKTCVRQPPLKLTLVVDVERWLSYKGTCHVILLAKLHDMYLYKTDNFFHINHYLKSVSKVALLHRFYWTTYSMRDSFLHCITYIFIMVFCILWIFTVCHRNNAIFDVPLYKIMKYILMYMFTFFKSIIVNIYENPSFTVKGKVHQWK